MKKLFANFTIYLRQLAAGAIGKLLNPGKLRTSNAERRTSKGLQTEPPGEKETSNPINPKSRTAETSNEVSERAGEHPTSNIPGSTFNQDLADLHPAVPFHEGEVPNFGASGKLPPRPTHAPTPNASPHKPALLTARPSGERTKMTGFTHAQTNPTSAIPNPTPAQTWITREELKRELDSLRRTIESKGK